LDSRAAGLDRLIPGAVLAEAIVLVVDDVEANVVLLERLLRRAGVGRVVGITDPRRTIEQYRALEPDLILLDLHMPHLDGVAVLEALGDVIPPDSFTPVLVLTADSTSEAKERALAAGAKDFVTKPFEQTEVLLRVKNLLETRALHLSLQRHNAALRAEIRQNAEREHRLAQEHERRLRRVRQVLETGYIAMVFQPIVDLATSHIVGVEALARFPFLPQRPPDQWFAEAAELGLGPALELLAIRAAVEQIDQLPPGTYLSVNASPATAQDPSLPGMLRPSGQRIVLELTEHARVDEYDRLLDALEGLRRLGIRIAVDDAGSGYASLQHIVRLHPDVIKLDIELTRGIHADPARRALAASLVGFAAEIGATITAEGIETAEELDTLRRLRVRSGQGYHLARPAPLPVPSLTIAAQQSGR
jgi:EAL domain-containing protein (putative c-di-GMP-specific phosphodiesterase class I)